MKWKKRKWLKAAFPRFSTTITQKGQKSPSKFHSIGREKKTLIKLFALIADKIPSSEKRF
jgi:hypothetical protein